MHARRWGAPSAVAIALGALGIATGGADGIEPLREGLELTRRCGAAALAKRAYDELQASGERVCRYTPIGVESLTPSERRVAELAATGLTNLAAVYDKLGIHARHQLPDELREPAEAAVTAR